MFDPRDPTTHYPGVHPNNRGFTYPRSGLTNVAEYQASGLPYVTQSAMSTTPHKFEYPYVTNEIDIKNEGTGTVFVGFTELGVQGSNRFALADNESIKMRIRTKEIWVVADSGTPTISMLASMTTIDKKSMPTLSGAYADPDTGQAAFITGSDNPASYNNVYGYDGLG